MLGPHGRWCFSPNSPAVWQKEKDPWHGSNSLETGPMALGVFLRLYAPNSIGRVQLWLSRQWNLKRVKTKWTTLKWLGHDVLYVQVFLSKSPRIFASLGNRFGNLHHLCKKKIPVGLPSFSHCYHPSTASAATPTPEVLLSRGHRVLVRCSTNGYQSHQWHEGLLWVVGCDCQPRLQGLLFCISCRPRCWNIDRTKYFNLNAFLTLRQILNLHHRIVPTIPSYPDRV